jgi:hypothetical protein
LYHLSVEMECGRGVQWSGGKWFKTKDVTENRAFQRIKPKQFPPMFKSLNTTVCQWLSRSAEVTEKDTLTPGDMAPRCPSIRAWSKAPHKRTYQRICSCLGLAPKFQMWYLTWPLRWLIDNSNFICVTQNPPSPLFLNLPYQ